MQLFSLGMDATMSRRPHRITLMALVMLVALLTGCVPTTPPSPTAALVSTSTPAPTATLTLLTLTVPVSTLVPTSTPRPTRTPRPTVVRKPTPTSVPVPEMFRPVIAISDVLSGTLEHLHASSDGALWLVTDWGVARLKDNTRTVYLADYQGMFAGIDVAGRVWVANQDASKMSAWDGTSWTTWAADAGWTPVAVGDGLYVNGGQGDKSGRTWFTTSQDVRVFDGRRWTVFTPKDMGMDKLPDDLMHEFRLTIWKDSQVWVTEGEVSGPGPFGGQGVRWFEGQSWHGADSPVASGYASGIAQDRSGRIWVGVERNLWRYDPTSEKWTRFALTGQVPFGQRRYVVSSVVLDSSGDPWVWLWLCGGASCDEWALYHIRNGVWTQVTQSPYYVPGPLIFDATGTPWLFGEGIARVAGDVLEPMASFYAGHVTVDASGRIWFVAKYQDRDVLWTLDAKANQLAQ